ncbi:hypothetical protein GXM_08555 [Nostoc sphaeroides CCNUC1]|uniref:Uncharacterized protein n=1 Tax=Nostoc sphaeroides CCNUC1 TaxID=2653204 RepID=A0A5P8WES4_9NOSO|nr:hypothetical protein GXM_08555 [Nostoc sphaeroides CCNUC1]
MNANNGIISQLSQYSVPATIDRFAAILEVKGITVFARIRSTG